MADPIELDALVARARQSAAAGKLDDAVAGFRRVIAAAPDHVEAHAFVAREMSRRGDARAAVLHAEHALAAAPGELALHELLAKAHLALLKHAKAEAALAAIVEEVPAAYVSLLHLSRLREVRGDRKAAILGYTRAIHTARARGFWHDEATTPPWLRPAVEHALRAGRAGKLALFDEWKQQAERQHGKAEMKRVARCLAMYLGLEPKVIADPRQQPSFLYFPDLPVQPVFRRGDLAFAEAYEAQADAIRAEALAVLEAGRGVQPFHYDVPEERRDKLTAGDWDAYFFFDEGERQEAAHAACPRTSAALAAVPLDHVRQHGPEVCFSIMRPGAHILPHRGVTNTRSVLHLGLVIPDGCALHIVGVEEVHWQPGRCFAFDDTYLHEAWNRSDTTRMVLLGDIWNPHLTPPERIAVADLVGTIGDFNRATKAR